MQGRVVKIGTANLAPLTTLRNVNYALAAPRKVCIRSRVTGRRALSNSKSAKL